MEDLMVKKIIAHPLTEKLILLKEEDLTKKVIMPILKAIKYSKVEYYGGVYEEGKDIICWGIDEFDHTILAVAQVKKYRPTAAASDKQSFSEVITQLQQCCEEKVPNINDGKKYMPTKVYFFTPYPIDTRALKTRFEKYQVLRENQVQIIDGDLLAIQVEKILPDITRDLLGDQYFLQNRIVETLNNKDLLNALQFSSFIDISQIYSDLDFCVGGISSTQFASYCFLVKKVNFSLPQAQWDILKYRVNFLIKKVQIHIFSDSIEDIEKEYNAVTQYNIRIRKKIAELNQQKMKFRKDSDKKNTEISDLIGGIDSLLEEKLLKGKEDFKNYNNFLNGLEIIKSGKGKTTEENYQKKIKNYEDSIVYFESKFFKKSNCKKLNKQIEKIFQKIEDKNKEIQKLNKDIKEESYNIKINSTDLVSFLNEKQKWIKRKAREFNGKKPTINQLRTFLIDCQDLFELVEVIIFNPIISQSIGLGETDSQSLVLPKSEERFSLSVHSIFDTGLNIILLGGAGAGKTTSLQMYTKKQLENTDKKVFYLPLARVLSTISKPVNSSIPTVESLMKAIFKFS